MKWIFKYLIPFLFLFFLSFNFLLAQNLFPFSIQYDPCLDCSQNNPPNPNYYLLPVIGNFTTPDVKSDFGPRYLSSTSPYDWHGGIDFSSAPGDDDRGYHLRAIVGGQVSKIGGGTKYIVIDGEDILGNEHDFGYLHIFSDGGLPRHNGVRCLFDFLTG